MSCFKSFAWPVDVRWVFRVLGDSALGCFFFFSFRTSALIQNGDTATNNFAQSNVFFERFREELSDCIIRYGLSWTTASHFVLQLTPPGRPFSLPSPPIRASRGSPARPRQVAARPRAGLGAAGRGCGSRRSVRAGPGWRRRPWAGRECHSSVQSEGGLAMAPGFSFFRYFFSPGRTWLLLLCSMWECV